MIAPLTRAVCQLSIACLLTARPTRTTPAILRSPVSERGGRLLLGSNTKHPKPLAHFHKPAKAMQTQAWQYPKPLTFPSKTKHSATVIILHGLGDTAHGWADFAPMLQAQLPHVKFVFPTAPTVEL